MARSDAATSRRWWTLATVSLTQLLLVLDGTIVNVALPRAQVDLGLGDSGRQWVVTAYALAFGSFLLLGGRVGDYWGRKRTFLLGLVGFGVGSAWGGLTRSAGQLIAARGLQGLAAAFLAPAALAFVTISFPEGRERNRAFAIFGSLAGAGSAAGMLLGGVLTQFFSWRWCLLVNLPLVAVGLVAGSILLGDVRAEGSRHYDLAGGVTGTLGFAFLVYGLTLAQRSWTSSAVGCLAAGAAFLIGFVLVENGAESALLPLRVLADRTRATAFSLQALIGAGGVGAMVYLALHLQLVLGLSPLLAGLATLPFTVSLMSTVPFAVRRIDRAGPRGQLVFGPLISACGLALLGRVSAHGDYWTGVLPGVVALGVGMGFAVVPLNNLALSGIRPRDAGVASATVTAAGQLGGCVGLAGLTVVYLAFARSGGTGAGALVAGYRAVYIAGAGVFVAAAAVSWSVLRPGAGAAIPPHAGETVTASGPRAGRHPVG